MSSAEFVPTAYLLMGTLGIMIGRVFWEVCREVSARHAMLRGRPMRSRAVFVAGWEAICVAFVLVGLVATQFLTPEGYLRPPSGSIEAHLVPLAFALMLGGGLIDLLLVAWWLQPLLLRWCTRVMRRLIAVFYRP